MVRAGRAVGVGRGVRLASATEGIGVAVARLVWSGCSGTRLTAISTPPISASAARPTIIRSPAVLDGRRPSDVESGT